MEENFEELLEKSNCVASFPCETSAIRFALFAVKRGYKTQIKKYDEDEWQGYYKVTYWKEDNDESQD